jgi:5-methylcytosine-specific restriction enzyme subunit McrC
MSTKAIQLQEWSRQRPILGSVLKGVHLSTGARLLANNLGVSRRLEILELSQGLELRTTSWVGRIVLDDITISIHPKINGMPLLNLLRYAYKLRHLEFYDPSIYGRTQENFQDLILQQLAAEATELISRGLHREYESRRENLSNPKGRLDLSEYVRQAGQATATLPCVYYPRTTETLLNQVLVAGLQLGAGMASEMTLKVRLRDLARRIDLVGMPKYLDRELIVSAQNTIDRRTEVYRPSLTLIEMLVNSQGLSLDGHTYGVQLPGFLFDMNRFFQALISRFLAENLIGYAVQNEYQLKDILAYDRLHNPKGRRSPTPRPDFVVMQSGQIMAVLDAKYRDLWENNLPPYMLYQLAIYALMQPESSRKSIILYPTLNSDAIEQIVVLRGPITGELMAEVVLRPVHLIELEQLLIARGGPQVFHRRAELAHRLTFGPIG